MQLKRENNYKLKIIIFFIFAIILLSVFEQRFEKKIIRESEKVKEELKGELKKTEVKNIFIIKNDTGLALVFIKNIGDNIVIDKLQGIGNIEADDKPIRIYDGKFGFLDKKGEVITPLEYEEATDFIDGIAVVKKEKYGILDKKGKLLLPFIYDFIFLGKNRNVILVQDDKYYLSNLKRAIEIECTDLYQLDDEKIIFEKDELLGVMSFSGEILIPNEYSEISRSIDTTFIGEKNGKYSIYLLEGNKKITEEYDYIEQLDKNVYKGGTQEIGKYAFLSEKFSTEEKYDEIFKTYIDAEIYVGKIKDEVEIIDEKSGIISRMSIEEFNKKRAQIKKE